MKAVVVARDSDRSSAASSLAVIILVMLLCVDGLTEEDKQVGEKREVQVRGGSPQHDDVTHIISVN